MTAENKHNRRSIRLPHYDYADEGAYFVTICTHERVCLFGTVDTIEDAMTFNMFGRFVWDEWEKTGQLRDNVKLDRFVVMPNHVHGIIWITENANHKEQENEAKSDTESRENVSDMETDIVGAWRANSDTRESQDSSDNDNVGARCIAPLQPNIPRKFGPLIPKSLHTIVGTFKAAVTRKINRYRNTPGGIVWQRNYWERVIRNEEELNWLRWYIDNNPARWKKDKLYVSKSDIMT